MSAAGTASTPLNSAQRMVIAGRLAADHGITIGLACDMADTVADALGDVLAAHIRQEDTAHGARRATT